LFVRKAALEGPGPAEVIAKIYKLTPTELRVLLAVVEVGGAPEVAEALWRCGDDDQVSPEGSVRKNRHASPGRSRQDRGRLLEYARRLRDLSDWGL
jgi:hypothetical protein